MISNHQTGYYDMDNNVVIGDNSSEVVDVLNTTPFSVRDILNIANQNNEENANIYQDPMNAELFTQKFYGNACGNYGANSGGSGGQYKR
jgi:hypothetical protein